MQDRLWQRLLADYIVRRSDEGRWCLFPRNCEPNQRSVRRILKVLQPKKLLWQRLTPRTRDAARVNTLSSQHGLGAFPFHTDFATATVPPRYVLLAAPRPRETETLLFDAHGLISVFGLDYLLRCLFLQHGRTSRYCRLLTLQEGRPCFRYNKAVMTPWNTEAHEVARYIEADVSPARRVDWLQHRLVLIDNWSTFHARSVCQAPDGVGLYRFAIWGGVYDLDC